MITSFGLVCGGLSVIIGASWLIILYNKMRRYEQLLLEEQQNLIASLKRRYDLVPTIVNVAKASMAHERTIQQIAIVQRYLQAGDSAALLANQAQLNGVERHLKLGLAYIVENYPELKTVHNLHDVLIALTKTENDIAATRRLYNRAAAMGHDQFRRIPHKYFLTALGFKLFPFIEFDVASSVNVSFES
jgi:LemA protein